MGRLDGGEWFEVDEGGRRLTHRPSGDTALRNPWMLGRLSGLPAWREELLTLFVAHPGCHLVMDPQGHIVDDVRRWPHLGGGYAVGEVVVSVDGAGEAAVAREVVARVDDPEDDVGHHLLLEDGNVLSWSWSEDRWYACGVDGVPKGRTRPPADGDDLAVLTPSIGRLLGGVCHDAIGIINEALGMRGSHRRCSLGHDVAGEADDHVAAMLRIRAEGASGAVAHDDASDALRSFARWLGGLRDRGDLDGFASHEEVDTLRRAQAVADTVERRAAPRPSFGS